MEQQLNQTSLDTLCAALCYAMGVPAPDHAAPANPDLCAYVDKALGGKKCDRVLMYNPDAIAQWVYEKYRDEIMRETMARTELELPLRTVMPSVTPVCFGTMYTGAQPEVHGIQTYAKPVIKLDSIFDALIRAGKRCCILGDTKCSLCNIFLERDMDYFPFDEPAIPGICAKAAELVIKDEYDFIVVYNGNYDARMHKVGPEGLRALGALNCNDQAFGVLDELVKTHWQKHNSLVGFAMDHGCHEIEEGDKRGTHGFAIPEDLNIVHRYVIHPATV